MGEGADLGGIGIEPLQDRGDGLDLGIECLVDFPLACPADLIDWDWIDAAVQELPQWSRGVITANPYYL